MREIELKFSVADLDSFLLKLNELGCNISEVLEQKDTVYVENKEKVESVEGSLWLRVRQENDKVELNLKKQGKKKSESLEFEFEVADYDKANCFLATLGYKEWVRVHKRRRYSTYLNANICIDEVERLGNFVEIEFLVDENDTKIDYEEKIKMIAKDLGIDTTKQVDSHYDTMIAALED